MREFWAVKPHIDIFRESSEYSYYIQTDMYSINRIDSSDLKIFLKSTER